MRSTDEASEMIHRNQVKNTSILAILALDIQGLILLLVNVHQLRDAVLCADTRRVLPRQCEN